MIGSGLGWVSFGSAEAEAVNALIGALTDSEARDELGIGAIRDGFADLLFPGTSTVQTRLRYFLMIPRLFASLSFRTGDHQAELRESEARLIQNMLALPDTADRDMLIGIEAGASLKRMPSAIYWAGLGAWGIRLDDRARIGDVLERMANKEICWAELPSDPLDDSLGLQLSADEADWIVDRCAALRSGQTLLGILMCNAKSAAYFSSLASVEGLDLPPGVKRQVNHAMAFSETLYGAALLYNLMLAERFAPDAIEDWQTRLDCWKKEEIQRAPDARALISPLLEAAAEVGFSLKALTENFINSWLDVMHDPTGDAARNLIIARERQAKPGRARLQMEGNYPWSGSSGASRLTFRWGRVQRYLVDVAEAKQP